MKRDKKRAEEFQQKKWTSLQEIQVSDGNTDTVFDTDLFLPTPPVSQADISVQACDTPVSTFTACDTRPQSEVGQTSVKGKLADNGNTFAACFGFEDTETDKQANLTQKHKKNHLRKRQPKRLDTAWKQSKFV